MHDDDMLEMNEETVEEEDLDSEDDGLEGAALGGDLPEDEEEGLL